MTWTRTAPPWYCSCYSNSAVSLTVKTLTTTHSHQRGHEKCDSEVALTKLSAQFTALKRLIQTDAIFDCCALHVRGAQCFEDVRTFQNIVYTTYKEAAAAKVIDAILNVPHDAAADLDDVEQRMIVDIILEAVMNQ